MMSFITNDERKRKVVYPAGGGAGIDALSNPN
jgi:hypothetical protein